MQHERFLAVGPHQPRQVRLLDRRIDVRVPVILYTRKKRSSRTSMLDGWMSSGA
jgi:hypothetical protein